MLCREKKMIAPTIYQVLYNPFSRAAEKELFPCLRRFGISIRVFNPLAGGLLTGKYSKSSESVPTDGRFALRPHYQSRFWHEEFHKAVSLLESETAETNVSLVEATFRWFTCHSPLNRKDGIILGFLIFSIFFIFLFIFFIFHFSLHQGFPRRGIWFKTWRQ